jgi:hypothetical protein
VHHGLTPSTVDGALLMARMTISKSRRLLIQFRIAIYAMGIWGRRVAKRRRSSNALIAEARLDRVFAEVIGAACPRVNLLSIDSGKGNE